MTSRELTAHAAALSASLGVEVLASDRLDEALTHPSASSRARPDNQRLEFLGDRVLGLVISEAVFDRFPDAPEGRLAPRFNALVRKETCAEVAESLGLGPMLRLGRSEALGGGRKRPAVLGDAMEALIAAIYLDSGMDAARAAILAAWGGRIDAAARTRAPATYGRPRLCSLERIDEEQVHLHVGARLYLSHPVQDPRRAHVQGEPEARAEGVLVAEGQHELLELGELGEREQEVEHVRVQEVLARPQGLQELGHAEAGHRGPQAGHQRALHEPLVLLEQLVMHIQLELVLLVKFLSTFLEERMITQ